MIKKVCKVFALMVAWRTWKSIRSKRQEERLERYVTQFHGEPGHSASQSECLALFWLGQAYAKYGTDKQLHDWYRIMHGPVGGKDA